MALMSNWDRSTEDWADTKHNIDVAHRAFAMPICARVVVLKSLLEKLPPNTARRRWVLVRAMPPVDLATDIFVAVLKSFRAADKTDLIDFTEAMLKGMREILGKDSPPPNQAAFCCGRRSPRGCRISERIFSFH